MLWRFGFVQAWKKRFKLIQKMPRRFGFYPVSRKWFNKFKTLARRFGFVQAWKKRFKLIQINASAPWFRSNVEETIQIDSNKCLGALVSFKRGRNDSN